MEQAEHFQASRYPFEWHHDRCFGCGSANPIGLHADFTFDEKSGEIKFIYHPSENHEGAPGYVHGGILASILDESQGMLCFHLGKMIMTDQLNLKYIKATPLQKPFIVECRLTATRKRRLYTKGCIYSMEGELLVSSNAKWYILNERITKRIFSNEYTLDEKMRLKGVLEANRKRADEIKKRKHK